MASEVPPEPNDSSIMPKRLLLRIVPMAPVVAELSYSVIKLHLL